MKAIYLILVLCCALSARADVIVYKNAITVTRTGAGTLARLKITGWTVIDAQTTNLTTILADPVARTFSVESPTDYEIPTLNSAGGKSVSVIAIYSGTARGAYVKGSSNPRNPYSAPTSGKVSGFDLFTFVGSDVEYLDEYSGTLSLDKKTMQDANAQGYTLQNAVDALSSRLVSIGFTQQ